MLLEQLCGEKIGDSGEQSGVQDDGAFGLSCIGTQRSCRSSRDVSAVEEDTALSEHEPLRCEAQMRHAADNQIDVS